MSYRLLVILAFLHFGINASAQRTYDPITAAIQNDYSGMHSLLIAKGGKLVYEHYFNGFAADSLHDTRSAFKSVTSLLLGIAIDKGLIKSVDEKVATFFPENKAFAADPLKTNMTIKDLLEMRSGFDCDEWNDEKDCETAMTATRDWVKFCLQLPMKNPPGKVWAYTSCDPMLISGIINKASGTSIMDFAEKNLFAPLGITNYRWTVDPAGQGMTAGSFFIRPLDMVKLGELVLHAGRYHGKQLISEKWLKASTTATIPIPDFSFMKLSRSTAAEPQPAFYGYYWYNETVKMGNKTFPVVFASGNGGQYIMIVKKLDLVIVVTQGNFGTWKAKRAFDLLAKYILRFTVK
ncbi:CubicO group peptidase (beta-lactamase class C family) [Mucilaginibacter gracilis]|uniref:CubicO group peptidase (Beta-lactamase class C family) n=1 Tax=Mucilaginibacter gracilis TaxID=423350 RepID=A0A495J058_9SPHI|nr:serine hydrolase domain-containing protein [Mucilaginibacter gracilis]RKR82112.1 CubicO group peptidase (beta-lactamase class C family) [Mucilaginibacter gracilis]